jgi:hypothetical protein
MEWIISVVQLGPLSEWVSSVISGAAVITALVFSKKSDRRAEDQRLHSVFSWCERVSETNSSSQWILVVSNQTQYPIVEWSAAIKWISPDTGAKVVETVDSEAGVIPPGRSEFPWKPSKPVGASDAAVSVDLGFRDGNGSYYFRRK